MSETIENQVPAKLGPKFSLSDLFALITACGISFGIQEQATQTLGFPKPNDDFWQMAFWIVRVVVSTIAISGLFIVIRTQSTTRTWFRHPGYILLFAGGLIFILGLLANYVFGFTLDDELNMMRDETSAIRKLVWLRTAQAAISVINIGILAIGCFKFRWWWRLTFAALALSTLVAMIGMIVFLRFSVSQDGFSSEILGTVAMAQNIVVLISIVVLIVAVIADLVSKTRRDWVHWLGIFVLLMMHFAIAIITLIASRFLSPEDLFSI